MTTSGLGHRRVLRAPAVVVRGVAIVTKPPVGAGGDRRDATSPVAVV